MEVKKTAAGKSRIQYVADRKQSRRRVGKLEFFADQYERQDAAGNNESLGDQQCAGRRDQHIKGQKQIKDRRKMHGEMIQQTVALACNQAFAGFFHKIKHLGEQSKVKARRPIVFIVETADDARKQGKCDNQRRRQTPQCGAGEPDGDIF